MWWSLVYNAVIELTTAYTLHFFFFFLILGFGFLCTSLQWGQFWLHLSSWFLCAMPSTFQRSAPTDFHESTAGQNMSHLAISVCTMWPNANSLLCVGFCVQVFHFVEQTHDRRCFISMLKRICSPDTKMKIILTLILHHEVDARLARFANLAAFVQPVSLKIWVCAVFLGSTFASVSLTFHAGALCWCSCTGTSVCIKPKLSSLECETTTLVDCCQLDFCSKIFHEMGQFRYSIQ